jgi:hypothetical protein
VPEVPPSAALGVVRHTGAGTEYLVLADVSVVLHTDQGVFEFTDQVDDHNNGARAVMAEALDAGKSFPEAKAITKPHLAERRRSAMNREGGYWVASIDEAAAAHAVTDVVPGVREVVLASDGFMRALHLFGLVPQVGALFERNLAELAEAVRKAEHDDPETRAYPRWTVSDDICARRLRWVD